MIGHREVQMGRQVYDPCSIFGNCGGGGYDPPPPPPADPPPGGGPGGPGPGPGGAPPILMATIGGGAGGSGGVLPARIMQEDLDAVAEKVGGMGLDRGLFLIVAAVVAFMVLRR